jgi:predicted nucleic acid-binding protein
MSDKPKGHPSRKSGDSVVGAISEKYFVDTNILIYAHDRSQGIKHDRARQLIERLWASGQGVLSTQVLQELGLNLRRKVANPVSVEEIRRVIRDYLSWEIVVNTPEAVLQALEIEVRYKTSFWDALILQAAEQCGAAVLYSEDLGAKQRYGTVRVVNPLAA